MLKSTKVLKQVYSLLNLFAGQPPGFMLGSAGGDKKCH
jgi:hypothetical protein